jgi:hypothetical protein
MTYIFIPDAVLFLAIFIPFQANSVFFTTLNPAEVVAAIGIDDSHVAIVLRVIVSFDDRSRFFFDVSYSI